MLYAINFVFQVVETNKQQSTVTSGASSLPESQMSLSAGHDYITTFLSNLGQCNGCVYLAL
jgi:hypothetical protein